MRKKLLATGLAFIMLLTAVTACNGTDTPEDSSEAPPTVQSTTTKADDTDDSDDATDPETDEPSEEPSDDPDPGTDGPMTEVGTPRLQTLIVETQTPTDTPGQFNSYMLGTQMGFGIHQLMSAMMWEMDTVAGQQFGEVADGMPESNEDFTEHTVKIRQGIKWSDGEDLTAEDVAFTMNMIMTTDGIGAKDYYNLVFESVEATDDYTVLIKTKESFPRLALRFGVTIWGNDLRIIPEHIYSQVDDVTTFKDEDPVVAGPYTVSQYDDLGQWILYELREDWEDSTVGVVTGKKPGPDYVWFRYLGDDTTRQMALINNEVDILVEVTPEMIEVMTQQNDKIAAWYKDFPYATSDDPNSKGIVFNHAIEPYGNADFRWGVALAMNIDEVSLNIFDGVGRISAFPLLPATAAMTEHYYEPLMPFVEELELDLGDGTTIKPWDDGYAERMGNTLRERGYDIPTDEAELKDMFGLGWWKHDPEAAEKLFIKAGLEKRDDGWYYDDEPFSINFTYLADTEAQAGRGTQAAYDQLVKFGFDADIASESSATWDANGGVGSFEIAGYWPNAGITRDLYSQIQGFDNALIVPLGERGSGQSMRWDNDEVSEIIREMSKVSPDSDESHELGLEFMKIAITEMADITFHSGVKFVPTNSTYFENYPSADSPYNGPWWWWSCFKYILPEITPVN